MAPVLLTGRRLVALRIPAGPEVLELLPTLARALAGDGPALLPVPADEPAEAASRVAAAALETPLTAAEDDAADPTAFVVSTSGSTGRPKGALLPVSALRASAAATEARLGGPGRWLLALPAHHIAGLQVLLRSVATGTEPSVLDARAGFDPAAFAAASTALPAGGSAGGPRRYTSLVPTQLGRLLDHPAGLAALCSYQAVLVGGAATAPALLARARASGVPVRTSYGMSETCGGCVYDGLPLEGVTVRLEDSGRIRLGGAVLARGYRGRPGLTGRAFGAGPAGTDREFRTDDLGELSPDGWLRVLGRVDDVLVTGGIKVAPAEVERALSELPAVRECVVVGPPDPDWGQLVTAVVVATDPDRPPRLEELRAAARRTLPAAAAPRRLVLVDALPLRGPGKPDRTAALGLATERR